ncbi:unnamed protein product [Triticum turgidum subsp. durum]|uniref:Uncharacterized protein n=1 Tax=Triticum turgidum subsp. durum TaxID=4567 RepID=A0A9R0QCT4_TRITD|nr:unnamed protein product [Triticum turgidum subsp. durum]
MAASPTPLVAFSLEAPLLFPSDHLRCHHRRWDMIGCGERAWTHALTIAMHWRFWRPALYGHTISDDVGQAFLQTVRPQLYHILEAREELLQSLQAKNKRGSETTRESSENANESSAPAEEKVIEPSIIQDKEVSISEVRSFEEPTSDITPEIEPEKFPVSTTEVEIIDKSVIEEELLSVKDKIRAPLVQSRLHADTDEDEVDEWPDNDSTEEPEAVAAASNRASLGREEDVSFSDLEDDDDDDDGNKGSGK